jgi:mono/diheme cytochrome c family protein
MKVTGWITAGMLLSGCSDEALQRMSQQPKYRTYSQNEFFEDERAMRQLPLGTVPRERKPRDPSRTGGRLNGDYVAKAPVPVTMALLQRGRNRFNITCATCHGLLGDGDSIVAEKMSLRPPPSLHRLKEGRVGYFYEVITEGYGLMPSYAAEIAPEDRWAVAAYVRALRLSQSASLGDAPADIRDRLLREPR